MGSLLALEPEGLEDTGESMFGVCVRAELSETGFSCAEYDPTSD